MYSIDPASVQDIDEQDHEVESPDSVDEQLEIGEAEAPDEATAVAIPGLAPDIEEDLKRVFNVEEPSPKIKTQVVPEALIRKELRPEDLYDEGSI